MLASAPRDAVPVIETSSQPVQAYLSSGMSRPGASGWDVVFIDPPYELGLAELGHTLDALVPLLAPDAIVVLERGARTPAPVLPAALELERTKEYGDTVLYWLAARVVE